MEKIIRRYWLIAFFLLLGVNNFSFISKISSMDAKRIFFLYLGLSSSLLFYWIFYYCAYKKRGIKWLLFNLIISVVVYSLTLVHIINPHFTFAQIPFIISPLYIFQQILAAVFFVLSVLLIRVNVKHNRKLKAEIES